jgi:Ribose/xylose/arabinose/galactoside ABC-type transport systems, permease components
MKNNEKKRFEVRNLPNSTYIFILTFTAASLLVPNFFTPGNLSNLLLQSCILMTLSMGMSMCLMMGCIDLSIGGVVSMSGVIIAMNLARGMNGSLAILIGLICGALFGMLNGLIVTKLKVVPFIATFGAGGIAQSIANTLSNKRTITWEAGGNTKLIDFLGSNILTVYFGPKAAQILSISVILILTLIIIAIVLIIFKRTIIGSNIYAIGANEETARLSGINTTRWKIGIYMFAGLLASIAGMIVMIRTNSLQPMVGDGLEFQAVVSAVLGGNSLKGGKGSIIGALLGALTLYTVRNSMSLWGIDTSVVMVAIGCILVIGMIINETIEHLSEKKRLKETVQESVK